MTAACVPGTRETGTTRAAGSRMIDGEGERESRRDEPFDEPTNTDFTKSAEEAEPYFPPTDPVIGEAPIDSLEPGGQGDEALAERVRRELAQDASTTDLDLSVEVRDGVATLRGRVQDLADVDNALAVAGRVPNVVDVVDEIEVETTAG